MVFASLTSSIRHGKATGVYQDSNATSDLAAVILRYISSRPNACDTLEGVRDWWLARQRYEDSSSGVAAALRLLIERGQAEAIAAADGHVVYRAVERAVERAPDPRVIEIGDPDSKGPQP